MSDETQLRSWLGNAEKALMEGRREDALGLIAQARAAAAGNPDVLAACGVLLLQLGVPNDARTLIEQAIEISPRNPRYWVNLAVVLRDFKDAEGELRAVDHALFLDPYFFTANLQKGSLFEHLGDMPRAAAAYHACLGSLRPGMQLPGPFRPLLEHAQQVVREQFSQLDNLMEGRLAPLRQQFAADRLDRVDDCLAAFLGKKRIFPAQPTMTHFPRLPAIEFFERRDFFPWIEALEASTDAIRDEVSALLRAAQPEFVPDVNHAGAPLGQRDEPNRSPRSSALFLYKDGASFTENLARCPRTVAALAQVPQVHIPHRGPTAFISRLEAKTRIPPQTGSTNIRLTVHLPLIVPPGCGLRVGSAVREWQPGTALIFDDTIEHEAWNDGDQPRIILVFDIWNPLLTPAERELMTAATAAIAEFFHEG
jgi:aspartate beta-hydroxylase